MIKIGSIILTVWSSLNFFPSLHIVLSILFLGKHPPGLYAILSNEKIDMLDPEVLATVDSIGLFANGTVVALNWLVLTAIWKGLNRGKVWVFWALLPVLTISLLTGIAAGVVVGGAFLEINMASGLILATGFTCAAIGLFKPHGRKVDLS